MFVCKPPTSEPSAISIEAQSLLSLEGQNEVLSNYGNPQDLLVLNAGNGWEWGNDGMIINSCYGSFPHSLLSTSEKTIDTEFPNCFINLIAMQL